MDNNGQFLKQGDSVEASGVPGGEFLSGVQEAPKETVELIEKSASPEGLLKKEEDVEIVLPPGAEEVKESEGDKGLSIDFNPKDINDPNAVNNIIEMNISDPGRVNDFINKITETSGKEAA